jgi:5'-nucleotidase
MRILISNDDGIEAPGIAALERIARTLSDDVWVCAPYREQSGVGHGVTIHYPLHIHRRGEHRYAIDGTPGDCVMLAIRHIMRDAPPDLVLAGVNQGQNVAEDMTYSGTIGAAMEATLNGVRAMAMSQQFGPARSTRWDTVDRHGADVVRKVLAVPWGPPVLVNVNFPAVAPDEVRGIAVVPHGARVVEHALEERIDLRNRAYVWIGTSLGGEGPAPDIEALLDRRIAITPITLQMTHEPTATALRHEFA